MPDSSATKRTLAGAMKTLMQRRPFAKISVGDICECCGMNRKSFYYHFRDKYDLVNWIYYTEFVEKAIERQYEDGWELLESLCEYFGENRAFYINALQISGQNSFTLYFSDVLKPIIATYLREMYGQIENTEFFAEFFADAYLVSIKKWLCDKPDLSAHDFIALLHYASSGIRTREELREQQEKSIQDE